MSPYRARSLPVASPTLKNTSAVQEMEKNILKAAFIIYDWWLRPKEPIEGQGLREGRSLFSISADFARRGGSAEIRLLK